MVSDGRHSFRYDGQQIGFGETSRLPGDDTHRDELFAAAALISRIGLSVDASRTVGNGARDDHGCYRRGFDRRFWTWHRQQYRAWNVSDHDLHRGCVR